MKIEQFRECVIKWHGYLEWRELYLLKNPKISPTWHVGISRLYKEKCFCVDEEELIRKCGCEYHLKMNELIAALKRWRRAVTSKIKKDTPAHTCLVCGLTYLLGMWSVSCVIPFVFDHSFFHFAHTHYSRLFAGLQRQSPLGITQQSKHFWRPRVSVRPRHEWTKEAEMFKRQLYRVSEYARESAMLSSSKGIRGIASQVQVVASHQNWKQKRERVGVRHQTV